MSKLKLLGSTSGHTMLSAPASAGSNTLVLPPNNGTAGQVLSTDGNGNLTWVTQPTVVDNSPSWCLTRTSAWGMSPNGWRLIPVDVTTWNVGGGTIAAPSNGDTEGASWTCPSGKAGKYFVHANIYLNGGQNHLDDGEYALIVIQKNDTLLDNTLVSNYTAQTNGTASVQTSALLEIAVGDKLQSYVYHTESAGGVLHTVNSCQFSGFRLAGV